MPADTKVTRLFELSRGKNLREGLSSLFTVWVDLRECEKGALQALLSFGWNEGKHMTPLEHANTSQVFNQARVISALRTDIMRVMLKTAKDEGYEEWSAFLAKQPASESAVSSAGT